MLRRIVTKTSGDWHVIELDDGKRYRLSGLEQAARKGLVTDALADAGTKPELVDRDASNVETDAPFIRELSADDDGRNYRVRADNDEEFTVTADELKTMLTA